MLELKAQLRQDLGKEKMKKLRNADIVPAVVYGKNMEKNIVIGIGYKDLYQTLHAHEGEAIISLEIGDGTEKQAVVAREVQRDPVTRKILHVDFNKINMDEKSHFAVAIHHIGTAIGVRNGGVLESHAREIEVECLPIDIPETIEVDVSKLEIGDSIHVSDLVISDKIEVLTSGDVLLFAVMLPKKAVVEEEEEEVAEPEVVGEKKKDKEEA